MSDRDKWLSVMQDLTGPDPSVRRQAMAELQRDLIDRLIPKTVPEEKRLDIAATAILKLVKWFMNLAGDTTRFPVNFTAYVAQLVRRVLTDEWRELARDKNRHTSLDDGPELPEYQESDSEDALNRKRVEEKVRRAVEGLPERQPHVIRLRFFLGLTADEIAQRLGISRPTVNRDLSAATRTLRDELGDVWKRFTGKK